jgi:hypothetical protein
VIHEERKDGRRDFKRCRLFLLLGLTPSYQSAHGGMISLPSDIMNFSRGPRSCDTVGKNSFGTAQIIWPML